MKKKKLLLEVSIFFFKIKVMFDFYELIILFILCLCIFGLVEIIRIINAFLTKL